MDNQPQPIPTAPQTPQAPQPFSAPPSLPPEPPVSQPTATVSSSKRSKKPFFLTLLCLLLIAGTAYGVYAWQTKKVKDANVKIAGLQSQVTSLKKQIKDLSKKQSASGSTSANYAGWKTYTLKYEKLTFKYPAQWSLKDNSNSPNLNPNTDDVALTATDGFSFNIMDGMQPGGDPVPLASDSAVLVKFAGNNDFLVYTHPRLASLSHQDPNSVGSFMLLTNARDQNSWPKDKNVFSTSKTNNGGSNMFITAGYSSPGGPGKFPGVQQASADPEFQNAKLVIESMSY